LAADNQGSLRGISQMNPLASNPNFKPVDETTSVFGVRESHGSEVNLHNVSAEHLKPNELIEETKQACFVPRVDPFSTKLPKPLLEESKFGFNVLFQPKQRESRESLSPQKNGSKPPVASTL
jgi:hypothetical protein